ncbi:TetR/AcrR family transcriptional regulator [Streptosporangium sp. NPDC004379]|uniref:TetR/AcrR family transcriptional regulator n=1 Tax=Streptosporangium sp. NPDC004379 TaxID=3366189 RepID=UPI0036A47E60
MESGGSLRERLVDAGVELVTAGGDASVGLREIARRAGVSHGAPRRYFPTHHALLSAIAHRGFADLAARFTAAGEGAATSRERLRAIGAAYVAYAVENRGMFELMFRHDLLDSDDPAARPADGPAGDGAGEDHPGDRTDDRTPGHETGEAGGPTPERPRLRETTRPLFRDLARLVARHRAEQQGAAAGSATPGDAGEPPEVTAAALWANLHGLAQLWSWGSLPLMLGTVPADIGRLDRLVEAALTAHLGPARR